MMSLVPHAYTPIGLLDAAYSAATGSAPGSLASFHFTGALPLANWNAVVATCVLYLVVIFSGQYLMRDQARISPKPLVFAHNAFLSAFSFFLFACLVQELLPLYLRHGFFWLICNKDAYTPALQLIYYLNYLTKYYELIDTVFLVLAKKKLEFLHVYHHSLTMVLCFVELEGSCSVQWVPIILNLLVHTVMYYYYAISLFFKNIWWKRYLTTMQIVQFVLDIAIIYYASYVLLGHQYFGQPESCSGTPFAAYFGCVLISSYLLLFIQFFRNTYKKGGKKGSKSSLSSSGASSSPRKQRAASKSPARKSSTASDSSSSSTTDLKSSPARRVTRAVARRDGTPIKASGISPKKGGRRA